MTLKRETGLTFCGPLDALVSSGKTVDRDGAVVSTGGTSTVNNLLVLRNLFAEMRPAATLEIGLAYAASALALSQSHQDAGASAAQQHVAIDPFQSHLNYAGIAAVEAAGFTGYLRHVEDFSDRALPMLLAEGARFDIIYIDGSHLFEDVFLDAHYAQQLLNVGGVMLFDDSSDAHVAKVLKFLRGNMAASLSEVDLAPYRADAGLPLRYRAARALGRTQLTGFRKTGEGRRPWDSPLHRF